MKESLQPLNPTAQNTILCYRYKWELTAADIDHSETDPLE